MLTWLLKGYHNFVLAVYFGFISIVYNIRQMGAKQSKTDENCFPGILPHSPHQNPSRSDQSTQTIIDPRSPRGPRTPIVVPSQRACTTVQLVPVQVVELIGGPEKPLDLLRKKILKGFGNTDPRSPSLNRTPLVFNDSQDRTLDLDDTFSNLFVETNGSETEFPVKPTYEDNNMPDCSFLAVENCCAGDLSVSPIVQQQNLDPRSPSIGVERTPIILCDDDTEVNEDVFLENMLSTLTLELNASAESSFASLTSSITNELTGSEANKGVISAKPSNKHLDAVRVVKKNISKGPNRRQKYTLRQKIYEDCENQMSMVSQKKNTNIDNTNLYKGARTPLSCMRNRSRSVESSTRAVKAILALQSYDDNLISNDKKNVTSRRLLCDGSED